MWTASLVLEPFAPEQALARFEERLTPADGAVVTFTGRARGSDRDGRAVGQLFLEHHPRLTSLSLEEIASSAADRFQITSTLR